MQSWAPKIERVAHPRGSFPRPLGGLLEIVAGWEGDLLHSILASSGTNWARYCCAASVNSDGPDSRRRTCIRLPFRPGIASAAPKRLFWHALQTDLRSPR